MWAPHTIFEGTILFSAPKLDLRDLNMMGVCVCVSASGYEGGYCKARNTNR
jgi:hypothetical protein